LTFEKIIKQAKCYIFAHIILQPIWVDGKSGLSESSVFISK